MKNGKFSICVGIFVVLDIVYKLIRCASCNSDYFGIEMSGYSYLMIHSLLASILIYTGLKKLKESKKVITN